MNLRRLALRNIAGSEFRSVAAFLCALLVAGFTLATVLLIRGAEDSLRLALDRLGADIIVVPEGAEGRVESALLMGQPARIWMPEANLDKVAAVPGVACASPQLYLSSLHGAACCSVDEMFLVAYDPATDFTLRPWLERHLRGGLRLGEAIGGTYVFVPKGEQNIKLYGYFVTLKGNLAPTGTNLDQSMFLTFETAHDIARLSHSLAEKPLDIPPGSISAVLVKVQAGANLNEVAARIMQTVPRVTPIESPDLFLAFRRQIVGLLRSMLAMLAVTSAVSLALLALVFSMAANERRREIGVLRALGATRGAVCWTLLMEAGALALGGGAAGLALTALGIYLFRELIVTSLAMPFLFPPLPALTALMAAGLAVALAGVLLAALAPAARISCLDPAVAMRE